MKREEVMELYDDEYAASYEANFLLSPLTKQDAAHELELIRGFLRPGVTWLDVACGTGYFLRHFPHVERAGIDLSPAMLRVARKNNPDISLIEHDYRDPIPEWQDRWGLVSCMWYAYGFVDAVRDLLQLIENLASWTHPDGTCFVPLAHPGYIAGVDLPNEVPYPGPGRVMITGILWSYVEDGGRKVHRHLIAPNVEFMVEQFKVYFETVSIIHYPLAFEGSLPRPALVATHKRHREMAALSQPSR